MLGPSSPTRRRLRLARHLGFGPVARDALGSFLAGAAGPLLRSRLSPPLHELAGRGRLHQDPVALVAALLAAAPPPDDGEGGPQVPDLTALVAEHAEVEAEVRRRASSGEHRLSRPEDWAVEGGTSLLLHLLVRTRRPEVVVETGVGNGHSTLVLLSALARNGTGRLFSLDIDPDVGGLLEPAERARWSLTVLDPGRAEPGLAATLGALGPLDLFLHDSAHAYLPQLLEYRLALAGLAPGGVLVSDDVDGSYAFVDACRDQGLEPWWLVDGRKVAGLAAPWAAVPAGDGARPR